MEYLGRERLKEPEVGLASAGERAHRHRPSMRKQEMSRCCKVFPQRDNWCRGVGGSKAVLSVCSPGRLYPVSGSGYWCPLRQKMSLLMLEASETQASPSLPAPDP